MSNGSTFIRKFEAFATAAIAILLLFPAISFGQGEATGRLHEDRVEGAFAPIEIAPRAQAMRRLPQSHSPARFALAGVESAKLAQEMTLSDVSKPGTPLKIGFSRLVPDLGDSAQTAAALVWTQVADRYVAAISVTSPDASGIRLGLLIDKITPGTLIRFYTQIAGEVFEVTGQQVQESINRNIVAGDTSDEAKTFWSPVILGQEITVEVDLPAVEPTDSLKISIPRISHLYSSPLNTRSLLEKIGQAAGCNLDAVCYQSTWSTKSASVAKMTFTDAGSSYLCTGTLMNDKDSSTWIPYFLSANHCIASQTEASSLQTYWFYQSSSCNSGVLNPGTQTLYGGATLLYANSATDTSFMQLSGTPPAGVYFAGWNPNLQSLGASVTGIHHPEGDMQKISFGTLNGFSTCTPGQSMSCMASTTSSANHLKVGWAQGVTEGGSSGSGLWANSGGSNYLVGQLHGGLSSCTSPGASDYYGRFDMAYSAALSQWLAATAPATLPAAPTVGSASAGNLQISITFIPGAIGNGTLSNYTGNCSSDDVNYVLATSQTSPVVVTGLTNGVTYHCWVKATSTVGSSPWSAVSNAVAPSATANLSRIINLSTRGEVQTGDNVMIGGFIIQGDSAKTVLIRAVGPNLANYGVTGVLANPKLQLYSGQTVIATNDDWGTSTNAAAITATGLAPVSPLESAILITLQPGAYTAIVSGADGGSGVGIVEVFAQ